MTNILNLTPLSPSTQVHLLFQQVLQAFHSYSEMNFEAKIVEELQLESY